ncbi:GntR family transcriptional regulator [Arthrobacter sp. SAFR-014]|uniref:GntR family transcriptional regulator n=1 Tax=unclassified Arthrobacter TaxID=235627 RepID=UPI003F7C480C
MATVNPSSGVSRLRVAVPAVATRVASELRLQIAEGALLPGTKLKEEALSEELGVSRNTVREAFAELASERLVVRQPNRGVFVASLEVSDIHDVYAVRRAIEVSAVRGGGSAESIGAVRAAVEEGKRAAEAGDSEGLGSANAHFHRALVAMAGSERLNSIMSQVLAEMRLFFHKASIDGGFYQDYLADNDQICSALEVGDNDLAAERLLAYLVRSEEHQTAVHAS